MGKKEYKLIDVAKGDMTFGQRIELGKILSRPNISETEAIVETMQCLFGEDFSFARLSKRDILTYIDYFGEVCKGLRSWLEKEQTLLKHEPTAQERQAGCAQLARKIGEFGTIKALAKAYGKDPDEILEWKYAKVFGILYTDLEETKYHNALHNIQSKSNGSKYKR